MAWKDWIDTAKDKARDRIVTGLFALIALLSAIVLRAFAPSVLDKVSEAVSKPALLALAALELIVIALLAGNALDNRRRSKKKPINRYNIHWDANLDPLCPYCDIHLPMTDRQEVSNQVYETFGCPKCRTLFTLYDEGGNRTLLQHAKARLGIERIQQRVRLKK